VCNRGEAEKTVAPGTASASLKTTRRTKPTPGRLRPPCRHLPLPSRTTKTEGEKRASSTRPKAAADGAKTRRAGVHVERGGAEKYHRSERGGRERDAHGGQVLVLSWNPPSRVGLIPPPCPCLRTAAAYKAIARCPCPRPSVRPSPHLAPLSLRHQVAH
jgi:hypothetical protein